MGRLYVQFEAIIRINNTNCFLENSENKLGLIVDSDKMKCNEKTITR